MPPDEFKTQVLLLHSEQSTLDSLSAGFGDRYTVHCATSGSDALSTLGDTPINVIVSVQDLPGMSGLEALREAKKRSPDTIGILIDEGAGEGLEAMVGDEEVFQVVRGNVSRNAILELVDDATKQLRLMTLAVSANDNAANVDDPDGEHITMETAQDGLTIVTDSSGRMPILDPQKVSETADSRSQSVDLLVLTRDSDFLETIKDSCRTAHAVHYASTLAQADQTIREYPVGVAVIDAGMIGSKIEQLTEYLRRGESRLVPIVAGRRDDGEMLMDLINRGKVYRFLLKPVSPGRARLAIESSAKFHVEAPDAAFDRKDSATPDTSPEGQPRSPSRKETATSKNAGSADSMTDRSAEQAVDDGLHDAFGGDDRKLSDTFAGFFNTLGGTSAKDIAGDDSDAQANEPQTATAGSRGSRGRKNIAVVAGITVIALLAGVFFWLGDRGYDVGEAKQTVSTEQPVVTAPAEREFVAVDETTASSADGEAAVDGGGDETGAVIADKETAADVVDNEIAADVAAEETVAEITDEATTADIVAEVLTTAETALLESRLDDAAAALQQAATADPDNVRLPFLNAQLSQAQLREFLREARSAILDSRLVDASGALAAARSLNPAITTEIEQVENELAAARNSQIVEDALLTANARLESGALLAPANDNARHFFEKALATDPGNGAARQGLSVIGGKLILQARSEIDQGRLGAAERLLATAKTLGPSNNELATAAGMLSSRRDAIAAKRAAEALNRGAAAPSGPVVELPSRATSADEVETPGNDVPAAEPPPAAVENSAPDQQDIAESPAASTVASDANAAPDEAPKTADTDDSSDGVAAPAVAAAMISSLTRIKYVAPKYPRAAERRKQSGWVDVLFTVATDGTVKDIKIQNSEPGETFVASAGKAVAKWQFEPVVEGGTAVEKRVGVRMMFALE